MAGALQTLIDEILQIPNADAATRLSIAKIEQNYRDEYESDFREFQDRYDSESEQIARREAFCDDCSRVVQQLRSRVQLMVEEPPHCTLVQVILADHVRKFLLHHLQHEEKHLFAYNGIRETDVLSNFPVLV